MIYLDHASTTPMSEKALQTYVDTARYFPGNSQSVHDSGTTSAGLLEQFREVMASSINGHKNGVIFTSGGTESNMLAVDTYLASSNSRHIVTSAVEHASMFNYLKKLERSGYRLTILPTNRNGHICLDALKSSLSKDTALVTIQYVNSELGTLQDIQAIGAICQEFGVPLHSDMVQAFGKIPIDVEVLGVDSLSISSHKFYGPKGIGICYISPTRKRVNAILGTTHEMGFRPGTVNLPAVAGMVAATLERLEMMGEEYERIVGLRRKLLDLLGDSVKEEGRGLPHILGLTLSQVEGQLAMLELSKKGIMVGTGSACHAGMEAPSRTLLAIGKSEMEAKTFIRVSFGKDSAVGEVEVVGEVLLGILGRSNGSV